MRRKLATSLEATGMPDPNCALTEKLWVPNQSRTSAELQIGQSRAHTTFPLMFIPLAFTATASCGTVSHWLCLRLKCAHVEPVVDSPLRKQLLVLPLLHHMTLLNDDNFIGPLYG